MWEELQRATWHRHGQFEHNAGSVQFQIWTWDFTACPCKVWIPFVDYTSWSLHVLKKVHIFQTCIIYKGLSFISVEVPWEYISVLVWKALLFLGTCIDPLHWRKVKEYAQEVFTIGESICLLYCKCIVLVISHVSWAVGHVGILTAMLECSLWFIVEAIAGVGVSLA